MLSLNLDHLVEYTDWEREKWHEWLRERGDGVLKIGVGPNADSRFETAGDLIRHIFSAEKRYVERLSGKPLTDTATIPNDNTEALFQFGEQSRKALKTFLQVFPEKDWDTAGEYQILTHKLTLTPRKIMTHVLLHEIRHWAQIATLFRLNGLTGEFHDFLFSPVMGETRREEAKPQGHESR